MQILVFTFGLILFIGLVLVHEWGHFWVAKRNGVKAEEFGLFFPPRLWSKKLKSGMRLSINLLPVGGFVKLKGENDSDERKGSLGAASLGAKAKIMLAGVFMNLLAGLFILMVLAWIGMPKLITQDNLGEDQFTVASDTKIVRQQLLVGPVIPGSPAAQAGLRNTDSIKSISSGGKTYKTGTNQQLHNTVTALGGKQVTIDFERDGQPMQASTRLLSFSQLLGDFRHDAGLKPGDQPVKITYQGASHAINGNQQFVSDAQDFAGVAAQLSYIRDGKTLSKTVNFTPRANLGVEPTPLQIQRSTWSAPVVAVGLTGQIFKLTFVGLGHALAGLGSTLAGLVTHNHQARENGQTQASSQVGGPVAIGVVLWDSGSLGFNFMLIIIAIVSLTLALMNVLPIPALDGGRLAMMLVSRGIFRRPLARATEERIVGASFMVLLALVALITIVDVKRFL